MIFIHLLGLLLLPGMASSTSPRLEPACHEAQISTRQCERYLWARERQQDLSDRLSGLERRLSRLESDADELQPLDLANSANEGGELWKAGRLVSKAIDGFGSPQLKGSMALRIAVNNFNERLADSRDRLLALERRAELSTGGPALPSAQWLTAPAVFRAMGSPVDQAPMGAARPKPSKIAEALSSEKSTVSRRRAFRASAQAFEEEQREAATIKRAHDRGETRTFGDPRGRAALLHRQKGQTCAIVATQQLLLEHEILAAEESSSDQEDELFEEAVDAGYYRGDRKSGGTPWQFVGNLAQDYGLIVVKRVHASDDDLTKAVASGKMVLADVDSSIFWHNRDYHDATHSIVVTGLELDQRSGKARGFYINDSDGGVYFAAGRLVPAETFFKAWRARAARFIEVK